MDNVKNKFKIGLTGHGSGGHFFPLIAVGQAMRRLGNQTGYNKVELQYYGPTPFDQESLDLINASFVKVPAGKRRGYWSYKNIIDVFKIAFGCVVAFIKLAWYYPDVVFSKGGYASFPVVIGCRLLQIPLMIHDSDIIPGRVSAISSKWAQRVALAWPQALEHISNPHSAIVGIPIRDELLLGSKEGGRAYLRIPPEASVILVIGGSQGATIINSAILASLKDLLADFYIVHQVGLKNESQMRLATETILNEAENEKYRLFGNLNALAMAKALGAADIVITRAGASGLFETAGVGSVPAIVIPINESINDHQRMNAYAFAESGAGIVIEESNLTPEILRSNIADLLGDKEKYYAMQVAAKKFSPPDTADKIARELYDIAQTH